MIKKSFIAGIAVLLLVISILAGMYVVEIADANPAPLPPKFTVESPQNNTVFYGTDSANISLTLETVSVFDYYYSFDNSITDFPVGKSLLNLTISSEKPLTHDKTYQCNIQFHNLTDGQHSVTLYYSYFDSIIPDWRHFLPVTTIVFSIDNSVTPSPKPTPSVPELPSWLMIPPLFAIVLVCVLVRLRN
jgi:hypothetical protein